MKNRKIYIAYIELLRQENERLKDELAKYKAPKQSEIFVGDVPPQQDWNVKVVPATPNYKGTGSADPLQEFFRTTCNTKGA